MIHVNIGTIKIDNNFVEQSFPQKMGVQSVNNDATSEIEKFKI